MMAAPADTEFVPDLAGLQSEISAISLEVDRFVESSIECGAAREGEYRTAVASYEESKKELGEKISVVEGREGAARAKHDATRREISECRAEIAQLKVEQHSLPAHLEVLKAEETKQLENIAAASAAASEAKDALEFEMNQLTRGIVYYKRLGLEMQAVEPADGDEGRIQLHFSKVDPWDSERVFKVTLGINEHNEFMMVETVPEVRGVEELCANLKATSNLTMFAVGIRKKFKELALATEHK